MTEATARRLFFLQHRVIPNPVTLPSLIRKQDQGVPVIGINTIPLVRARRVLQVSGGTPCDPCFLTYPEIWLNSRVTWDTFCAGFFIRPLKLREVFWEVQNHPTAENAAGHWDWFKHPKMFSLSHVPSASRLLHSSSSSPCPKVEEKI